MRGFVIFTRWIWTHHQQPAVALPQHHFRVFPHYLHENVSFYFTHMAHLCIQYMYVDKNDTETFLFVWNDKNQHIVFPTLSRMTLFRVLHSPHLAPPRTSDVCLLSSSIWAEDQGYTIYVHSLPGREDCLLSLIYLCFLQSHATQSDCLDAAGDGMNGCHRRVELVVWQQSDMMRQKTSGSLQMET